ncbi:MAG: hydrogenase iron-sulfur subunit [Candidatus Hodarchaeota archaeon]
MQQSGVKILAFVCNWCSLGGADAAGLARLQQPTNVRIIRVMCSGRIDPPFVFKAFSSGKADGVLITGCHIGDCHYLAGNFKTEKRYEYLRDIIEGMGLEPERIQLEWISASEGGKWAETINKFVATIEKLGPSPIRAYLNTSKVEG